MKAITVEPRHAGSARVETGAKPDLVRALGATYHTGHIENVGFDPDVIIECTGVGQVIADSLKAVGAGGAVCLTGVGSVNANKRHWYKAGDALARADAAWLSRLVTRRSRPADFARALHREPDDIKVVVQFTEA